MYLSGLDLTQQPAAVWRATDEQRNALRTNKQSGFYKNINCNVVKGTVTHPQSLRSAFNSCKT
jgi:hypothetical protein